MLLVLLIALTSVAAVHLLDGKSLVYVPIILIVAVVYMVNHRGRVELASHSIVWSSALVVTVARLQYSTEVTNVISIPALYAISILLASTLLGGRSVAAIMVATSALTFWLYLWVFPQTAALHNMPEGAPAGLFITTLTLLGTVAGLGWLTNRVIARAMADLRERNVRLEEEMAERKRAEVALRSSERRYRSLFEHNLAGVMRTLLDGTIVDCNSALVRMIGYDAPVEMIGRITRDFFVDPVDLETLQAKLHSDGSVEGLEIRLIRKDDKIITALISISQIEDENGQPMLEGTLTEITELKEKEAALELLSKHDPLTGLYNRRALNDIMARILRLFIEDGDHQVAADGVMSLILIDIDHFKLVNDNYGHQAGDAVLQEVGRRISLATRATDYVARYGGEEIAVLLPGASPQEARIIAERIRTAVAASPIALKPHSQANWTGTVAGPTGVKVTISLGVACGPDDMSDDQYASVDMAQEVLVAIADKGLYRAKNQGRNCVVAAGRSNTLHSNYAPI